MPEYIKHDPSSTPVQGRIVEKWYSVDPSIVQGLPNILKLSRDDFRALTKWHKVSGGQVVLMTQTEKDAILAQEEADRRQKLLDRIDKYEVSNLDLLTALVKRINVRIPTNKITKQEIIDQIKSDLEL